MIVALHSKQFLKKLKKYAKSSNTVTKKTTPKC